MKLHKVIAKGEFIEYKFDYSKFVWTETTA